MARERGTAPLAGVSVDHRGERRGHLSLVRLRKEYPSGVAVREVSVDIAPGEFFTMLGPSGSGKTTTLMMVAGFETPTAGEVLIDGRSIGRVPPDQRNIGVVFQNYALFPHMTVRDNLAFPLEVRSRPRDEIEQQVDEVLRLVRLAEHKWKYPGQLSGGQQQRVAIARAIVFSPPLLLMDEPLGALDKKLRGHLQLELRSLQRQLGVTVMYVTHDQEEALVLSDRIAVMNAGVVEQIGTPREVYDDPTSLFVANFLGDSNAFRGTVTARDVTSTTLRLDAGPTLGGPRSALALGSRAVGMIRPEQVTLSAEAASSASMAGRVTEVVYVGEATRYWVEIPSVGRVLVKLPERVAARAGRRFGPGDPAFVGWEPAELKLFPEEPGIGGREDPTES